MQRAWLAQQLGGNLFCAALLSAAAHAALLDSTPAPVSASTHTPTEHVRGTEQTYLTYPEWFLVHSPAEYAVYVKDHTPSDFPFIGHIQQFWSSYGKVYEASNDGYPFNFGYHVMIMVIGVSTTVEYALRSAYETLFGRLSDATRTHAYTEDDVLGAKVAQDYVDFIRVLPWYEYDFTDKLVKLWTQTGLWGPDPIRKWERKYALTTEYGIKALYGWMIKTATRASYDEASPVTAVVLDRLPEGIATELPELKLVKRFAGGEVLVTLPRYHAFTHYASVLAVRGVQFLEIAGNNSVILVSALAPPSAPQTVKGTKVLFAQPVLTQPGVTRVAFVVPVSALAATLNTLGVAGIVIEHVYDY